MADEENNTEAVEKDVKCEECQPGLPMWMGTFSDLVTLLLTFFVLLLSFAKTETSKYQAALGSIRKAFGGNVRFQGEVLQPGKSPDDAPTMIDSQEPVKPFPIDFLTTEGLLDKHEINRATEERLIEYKALLKKYQLANDVEVYEESEGLKVNLKDKVYFAEGSTRIINMNKRALNRVINMVRSHDWVIYVSGFAAKGEKANGQDAYELAAKRATVISKFLIENGVKPENIVTVSYGDSRPQKVLGKRVSNKEIRKLNRKVEFMFRKRNMTDEGHKINHY